LFFVVALNKQNGIIRAFIVIK